MIYFQLSSQSLSFQQGTEVFLRVSTPWNAFDVEKVSDPLQAPKPKLWVRPRNCLTSCRCPIPTQHLLVNFKRRHTRRLAWSSRRESLSQMEVAATRSVKSIRDVVPTRRLQNTLYPKSGRFCENNFWKLLIGWQPIIEERSLIYMVGGVNMSSI